MIKFNCSMSIESDLFNFKKESKKLSKLEILSNILKDLPENFFKEYHDYLKLLNEKYEAFRDRDEYEYLKSKCDNLYISLNEKYNFNPYFNVLEHDIVERYRSDGVYCQTIPLNEMFRVFNGGYDGWYSLENGVYYFNVCYYDEIRQHNITESYLNNELLALEITLYSEEYLLDELKNICESKYGKVSIPY